MFVTAFLVFCTHILLAQTLIIQHGCRGTCYGPRASGVYSFFNSGALSCGASPSGYDTSSTSGGNLPVVSSSLQPPTGLLVASENLYEGRLATAGQLPFVGTINVQGSLPTTGAGVVSYSCGDDNIGIFSENIPSTVEFYPTGVAPPATFTATFGTAPLAAFTNFGNYGDRRSCKEHY